MIPWKSRMRSGWIKESLMVFTMTATLLYLGSIKTTVHKHSERLRGAYWNDSIRSQIMLQKMSRMEADLNKLCEFFRKRLFAVIHVQSAYHQISCFPAVGVLNRREEKDSVEAAKKNLVVKRLYPNSVLFQKWGGELSEEEQKEAERLFHRYGYNAFLSDRLPLNREIPDTRPLR